MMSHMDSRKQSYPTLLQAVRDAFGSALQKGGMSKDQAFAFAYDEMERLLRDPSDWVRSASYVALFKVAIEHEIELRRDDPFDLDARAELERALEIDTTVVEPQIAPDELGDFELHADLVRSTYLVSVKGDGGN